MLVVVICNEFINKTLALEKFIAQITFKMFWVT